MKSFSKFSLIIVLFMVGVGVACLGFFLSHFASGSNLVRKLPTANVIDAMYPANFADDRILMGASHDVFIGRVISQIGTQVIGGAPQTQFTVSVIANIKGNPQRSPKTGQ